MVTLGEHSAHNSVQQPAIQAMQWGILPHMLQPPPYHLMNLKEQDCGELYLFRRSAECAENTDLRP